MLANIWSKLPVIGKKETISLERINSELASSELGKTIELGQIKFRKFGNLKNNDHTKLIDKTIIIANDHNDHSAQLEDEKYGSEPEPMSSPENSAKDLSSNASLEFNPINDAQLDEFELKKKNDDDHNDDNIEEFLKEDLKLEEENGEEFNDQGIEPTTQETAKVSKGLFAKFGDSLRYARGGLAAAGVSVINAGKYAVKSGGKALDSGFHVVKKGANVVSPSNIYGIGIAGVRKYVSKYEAGINKNEVVENAKEAMTESLNDPQFAYLFDFIRSLAVDEAGKKVDAFYTGVVTEIFPDKALFIDLIEITLAKRFAYVAEQLNEQRENIPNFDNQPMWLNALLYLYPHNINMEKVGKLKEQHQSTLKAIKTLQKELFPKAERTPEFKSLWNECFTTLDEKKRIKLLRTLFADEIEAGEAELGEQASFFESEWAMISCILEEGTDSERLAPILSLLSECDAYHDQISQLIGALTDDAVTKLFPNRLLDLEIPGIFKMGPVPGIIYDFAHATVKNVLTAVIFNAGADVLDGISRIEKAKSQYVELFDLDLQRQQLRDESGGEFFASFAHALSNDMINLISNKIVNEKELVETILKALGKDNPSSEEIDKMQSALNTLIQSLGRKKISALDLKIFLKDALSEEDKMSACEELARKIALLEGDQKLEGDVVLKALLGNKISKIAQSQAENEDEIEAKINELSKLSGAEILELNAEYSYEEAQTQMKSEIRLLSQELYYEVIHVLGEESCSQKEIAELFESIIIMVGDEDPETIQSKLEKAAEDIALAIDNEDYSKEKIAAAFSSIGEKYIEQLTSIEKFAEEISNQEKKLTSALNGFIYARGKSKLTPAQVVDTFLSTFDIASLNKSKEKLLKPLVEKLQGTAISEEEIADMIQAMLPPGSMDVRPFIVDQVHGMLVSVDPSYKKNREFLQKLIEGALLKLFTSSVAINKQEGKSPEEAIVKHIIDLFGEFIQEMKNSNESPEEISRRFVELLYTDVLGIASLEFVDGESQFVLSEQLNWLPASHQKTFVNLMTENLTQHLVSMHAHLSTLRSDNEKILKVKEKLKAYDKNDDKKVEGQVQKLIDAIQVIVPDLSEVHLFTLRNRIIHLIREEKENGKVFTIQDIANEVEAIYRYASTEKTLSDDQKSLLLGKDSNGKTLRDIFQANMVTIVEDLLKLVTPAVLDSFVREPEGSAHISGVTKISATIESLIESLAAGNFEAGKVLSDYTQTAPFKKMLGDHLTDVAGTTFQEEKDKAVEMVGNLLLEPLDNLIDDVLSFGGEHKAAATQRVMGNMFKAAGEHLDIYARAQRLARWDGREQVLHEDFMRAGGAKVHRAVPRKAIDYQQTIDTIKAIVPDLTEDQVHTLRARIKHLVRTEKRNIKAITSQDILNEVEAIYRYASNDKVLSEDQINVLMGRDANGKTLRDIIRQEAGAHDLQKNEKAYHPASKIVLKRMFPNGKHDLTFVPPEERAAVWKLLKKDLVPVILPVVMESVISRDMATNIVLGSLKGTLDAKKNETHRSIYKNMEAAANKDIFQGSATPAENFLGEAAGEMLLGILGTLELPGFAKKALIDPATGKISQSMQQTLGSTLAQQFNETFIEETIKTALAAVATRDAVTGKPVLNYDSRPIAIKQAESAANRLANKQEIHQVTREVIKASIASFVRTSWTSSQFKFDQSIKKVFGRYGLGTKKALDAVFRFVFFKVIGSVLSLALWPMKRLVLEIIYRTVSLDKNLDTVLGIFDGVPVDQPEGYDYAVYNENLIFKMMEAMAEAVREESEKEAISELDHAAVINDLVEEVINELDQELAE